RTGEGEEDYFVHISAFKKHLSRRPAVGDEVQFRPADLPGKKRVGFALIEGVEYAPPEPKPKHFVLVPKPRSWTLNALIMTPLFLSGYLLVLGKNPLPFFSYCLFSVLILFLYGADKTHAAIRSWRIPESYLHLLEILGGWPGALIAQNAFRHKTRKSVYLMIFHGIIALHLIGWAVYFYWFFR
ncbi:DUF1294 domain-containing protein, partial [Methylomagnum sp.]